MGRVRARWAALAGIAWALLSGPGVHASDLHFRLWTNEDGLPTRSVRAITQTPDGYLWIATLDGLVRFDGVRMRVFQRSEFPQMQSNRCLCLLVDREGALWAGTEDGGILRVRGTEVRAYGTEEGLPSPRIMGFQEDGEGRFWVHTLDGSAVRQGDHFQVTPLPARARGIPPLAPGEAPLSPEEATSFRGVTALFPATRRLTDEVTWFSTGAGRGFRWSAEGLARVRWPAVPSPPRPVSPTWTGMREGSDGTLWVMEGGVLYRRREGVWTAFADSVPGALTMARDLFEDREGTLWIGGDGGLVQASPTPVRALVPKGPGLDTNVYTLAGDGAGHVWVGTNNRAFVLDRVSGDFRSLAGEPWWPPMVTVEPDTDGSLLGGSPAGLFQIWPGRRAVRIRDALGEPRDFLRDREGTLWVAIEGGVLHRTASGWEPLAGLPSLDARVLMESRDGSLWIGTYGGLSRLSGGVLRTWTTEDGLASDRTRSLYEDAAGTVWVGSYDGGLTRVSGGKLVAIRKKDGLFDDGAFAILEDDHGRFWVSSNRGIYAVLRQDLDAFAAGTLRRVRCRAWTSKHGMPSSECNGGRQPAGFRATDGTLWFPTQGGIAVIDPQSVSVNTTPPLVVIEEITTDRRTIPVGPSLTLQPGERRLEVRYTANTFVNPEGTRFRHRLAPFDEDWVEAGDRRFAQYAYVPPGRYRLDVIAANSDGVWSLTGASLAIVVRPFWWQTLWFQAVAMAVVVGLLAMAYRRHIAQLKRRREEQDAFARSLLASQEAERKRIAGELHDGIGQTLVVIRNRALLGLQEGGDPGRQVAEISDAAAEGIEEVRKVAYGLRPYQIDRLGLRRALVALVEQSAASSGIPIAAEIGEVDGAFAKEAEINVYRIVQESLTNMARHARAHRGRVRVAVEDGEVALTIEDDGAGFDAAAMAGRGGLGLSGIAERARILGGRSAIRSSPGQGTTVSVYLPRTGSAA